MVQRQPMVLRGWPNEGKGRPDPTRDKFRTNLARIMAERGITQASLARTMDVSRVAVHAWIWVGALLENEAAVTPMPEPENSNEEALLLNAFRKLPNTARLTLLADAYELSAKAAAAQAAAAVRNEVAEKGSHSV